MPGFKLNSKDAVVLEVPSMRQKMENSGTTSSDEFDPIKVFLTKAVKSLDCFFKRNFVKIGKGRL
jgi:hypothetical protein